MTDGILDAPPVEAYLNNYAAKFVIGNVCLSRDEMRARIKDVDLVTSIYVPVSCSKCGAPFRAASCCDAQDWDYKNHRGPGATTTTPLFVREAIERSKPEMERHLAKQDALEEQRRLQQPAVVAPAAYVAPVSVYVPPVKPAAPLMEVKEQDVISLLSDFGDRCDLPEGNKRVEHMQNWFKPVNMTLLDHLNREKGSVSMNFSYPKRFEERVRNVWKHFRRELNIRPLPNPDTTRWGCSVTIQFPCPLDIDCLREYPAAYKRAEGIRAAARPGTSGGVILVYDVRLALQLCFQYGFELKGPEFE